MNELSLLLDVSIELSVNLKAALVDADVSADGQVFRAWGPEKLECTCKI